MVPRVIFVVTASQFCKRCTIFHIIPCEGFFWFLAKVFGKQPSGQFKVFLAGGDLCGHICGMYLCMSMHVYVCELCTGAGVCLCLCVYGRCKLCMLYVYVSVSVYVYLYVYVSVSVYVHLHVHV